MLISGNSMEVHTGLIKHTMNLIMGMQQEFTDKLMHEVSRSIWKKLFVT